MRLHWLNLSLLVLVLTPFSASAQTHHGNFLGHDYIPDTCAKPTLISVQDGDAADPDTWCCDRIPGPDDVVLIKHKVTISADLKTMNVGVRGFADLTAKLTCANLLVYEDGQVDMRAGSELVFRDEPTGGVDDPKQWKTGCVVLGRFFSHGTPKSHAIRSTIHILAGAETISLATEPQGWHVGDELLFPDTSQQVATRNGHDAGRLNEIRRIKSIDGKTVTLDEPLTYAHSGMAANPFGLERYPHVCNLTRDVVIRSENPAGTRGHLAWHMRGFVDLHYAEFRDLGRTRTDEPSDETIIAEDGTILWRAKNQRGRYPIHAHHSFGTPGGRTDSPFQSNVVGSVVRNAPSWGITVHGSHFIGVDKTVVYDVTGSGIMEEDGTEIHNNYTDCVIVGVQGHLKPLFKTIVTLANGKKHKFVTTGTNGSILWFTRQGSTAYGCVGYGCGGYFYISGYGFGWESMFVALTRGDPTKTRVNGQSITELGHVIENLEAVNCRGLLYYAWTQGPNHKFFDRVTLKNLVAWNCFGYRGILRIYHDSYLTIDGLWVVSDPEVNAKASRVLPLGIDAGTTYDLNFFIGKNINLSGLSIGVTPPTKGNKLFPGNPFVIESGTFDCDVGVEFHNARDSETGQADINATFLRGEKPRTVWTWKSSEKQTSSVFTKSRLRINGKDAWFKQQKPTYVVPANKDGTQLVRINGVNTNIAGLTNQQIHDKYGLILGGEFDLRTDSDVPDEPDDDLPEDMQEDDDDLEDEDCE